MRLISLTANRESFRALHFRPKGLSLILAKQKTPGSGEDTRTYNGVGKSLAIALIHFCLGSSTSDGLRKGIPEWEFEADVYDRQSAVCVQEKYQCPEYCLFK